VQAILLKKAENRPATPEEYTVLAQFVDRVERRTIQIKEEAARAEEERTAAARAEVPAAAFQTPLEQAGIKEHIFNILTEAGFETAGDLMLALKVDPNKILGLAGVGPKAMQNIEEALAALTFPEPEPAVALEPEPAAPAIEEPLPVEELPAEAQQAETRTETKKISEEKEEAQEGEFAKDGVSLDELFKIKPEIFQSTTASEEEEGADKKKGKKTKKKSVELEYDEELGAVVGRKKHKRAEDDAPEENW